MKGECAFSFAIVNGTNVDERAISVTKIMQTTAPQSLKSTDEGYVPVPVDELFVSLCDISQILDQLDVPYIITGGTLLGGVREGDLFPSDTDWDMEILDTDLNRLLNAKDVFAEKGYQLSFPLLETANPLAADGDAIEQCERRIVKVLDMDGRFHGDFFLHTLFSDGMLRRVSVDEGIYWNAKMTFPAWFFENRETVLIRGRPFACAHNPELNCERIYGPDWRLPKTRHNRVVGYNFAGAHLNANVEKSIAYALEQGWVPHYPNATLWPQQVTHTSTAASARWIQRHEHLECIEAEAETLDERNAIQVLKYRSLITKLKRRAEKAKAAKKELVAAQKAEVQDAARAHKLQVTVLNGKIKKLASQNETLKTSLAASKEKAAKTSLKAKNLKARLDKYEASPLFFPVRLKRFLQRK